MSGMDLMKQDHIRCQRMVSDFFDNLKYYGMQAFKEHRTIHVEDNTSTGGSLVVSIDSAPRAEGKIDLFLPEADQPKLIESKERE